MAMDDNGGKKVIGIMQIVRLKKILRKWKSATVGQKHKNLSTGRTPGGISPPYRRLRSSNANYDDNGGRKLTGIRQIVGLKKILQKWKSVALNKKRKNLVTGRNHGSISPPYRRLRSSNAYYDDNGGKKVTGIWQIVRLKGILQKWASVTLRRKSKKIYSGRTLGGISPAISRRLMSSKVSYCDLDVESCYSLESPPGVPRGCLAVYVGLELRRFIVPTSYLGHPLFKVLLEKTEEEFGFHHSGGLTIPCDAETFKYLLKCMENPSETPA